MIITYKNFKLKPGMYAKDRFDLSRIKPLVMNHMPSMKKKHGNKPVGTVLGETEEELGYDLYLGVALQKLISILLSEKEEVVDLKTYLLEYKKCKEEIENLLK
jgi:hypothetical protein